MIADLGFLMEDLGFDRPVIGTRMGLIFADFMVLSRLTA